MDRGKLLPKKYGEKPGPDVNISNTVQNIGVLTAEAQTELQRRHQAALAATRKDLPRINDN